MKTITKLVAAAIALSFVAPVAARDNAKAGINDIVRARIADRDDDRGDRGKRKEDRREEREDRREDRQDRREARDDSRNDSRNGNRGDHRGDYRHDTRRDDRHDRPVVRHEVRRDDRHDQYRKRLQAERYRQLYQQRLLERQRHWTSYRYHDRFFSTPFTQRYRINGRAWNTNQYGMQMLRDAANAGYAEGMQAGRADRYDNWRYDYRDSWAYRNAGYGYNGRYVDRDHYQHYFREGFRRGYEDGYYGRSQYGRRQDNGQYFMIAAILSAILGS